MPHDGKDGVHWHEPAGTKKAGFGEFAKQPTPYDAWMESEGLPVFRGIGISKVQNLPLVPWKRTGGRGHFIQLYGTETKWGCYVVEIPPGGARWYHQHFSVSKDDFRLTAWFGPHNPGRDPGAPGQKHTDYTAIDVNQGGTAIPYWMEDPYIRNEYEETLRQNGVPCRMDPKWYLKPNDADTRKDVV